MGIMDASKNAGVRALRDLGAERYYEIKITEIKEVTKYVWFTGNAVDLVTGEVMGRVNFAQPIVEGDNDYSQTMEYLNSMVQQIGTTDMNKWCNKTIKVKTYESKGFTNWSTNLQRIERELAALKA